jgi:hypothetical protein
MLPQPTQADGTPHRTDEHLTSAIANLEHAERVDRKRAMLIRSQADSAEAFLCSVARSYDAGEIDLEDLIVLYGRYRNIAQSGYGRAWDEHVSVPWKEIIGRGLTIITVPNGSHGSFEGEGDRLLRGSARPAPGVCVVYVLFDKDLVPCYVGSTRNFKGRLDGHRCSGKAFASWRAYPCPNREAAYKLEDRLLREQKPYLNKRAGR